MSRGPQKIILSLALALCGAAEARATAASVRVNPVASYSAATMGGHGIDVGAELFFDPRWALGVNAAYGLMRFGLMNSLTPDKSKVEVEFEDTKSQSYGVQLARYHGPNERLYALVSLAYSASEVHAKTNGEPVHVKQSSALPELGYGYRWLFRHGGFASFGGGMVYRVPLKDEIEGNAKPLKLEALGRTYPTLRLGIGYLFR